ncbi:MAG TPA: NAD(P)H-binding protein [Candidatus Saccharimonadales bacterium]|jgi:putative NADH-flavin reductase
MKIVIFGASGKVGRQVAQEALKRGHDITVFVHHTPPSDDPHLRIIRGDVHDKASIEQALDGQDAVICTLGSWGTKQKDILSSAMHSIVPAMEQRGIHRIVSLTGNVAAAPNEKLSFAFIAARTVLGKLAPKILRDSENHIAQLAASQLDWTVVRSPVMVPHGSPTYALKHTGSLLSATVNRTAVAYSLIDLLESTSTEWHRQAPYIARA